MARPDPDLMAAVGAALLDFEQAPGRHAVAAREPRLLFDHLLVVLTLAAERGPTADALPPAWCAAARFFVRTVLLHPDAQAHTLLGVTPETLDPQRLREHYRLLMRMTHPDAHAHGQAWPADTAARINEAYRVLSDPQSREAYVAAHQGRAGTRPQGRPGHDARPKTQPPGRPHARAPRRRGGAMAWTVVLATAALALTWLWPVEQDRSLQVVADRAATPATATDRSTGDPPPAVQGADTGTVTLMPPAQAAAPDRAGEAPAAPTLRLSRAMAAAGQQAMPADTPRTGAFPASPPPAPVAAETVAAAPVVARTASATASAPEPVLPAAPTDLRPVQPVLAELLQALQSGQQEQVRRFAATHTRQAGAAAHFADTYARVVGQARIEGVDQARFSARAVADVQIVDGVIRLRVADQGTATAWRDLRVKAHFIMRESGPELSQLDALQP